MNNLTSLILLAAFIAAAPLRGQVPPEKVESTFTVHNPELEWKLWASEPLFANPTSMDIDHLGRVWVCESVNYRTSLHKRPLNRPAGDRIVILEDSKGTGKADKATTFYQSPELLAPLGIAVAKDPVGPGWKVYLCQSPDILVLEDKDGDGKADGPPKKLLTGFKGVDHDHGVHGISIGPDGKLYFSVGDQGVENLQSSDGTGRKWTTNHTDCQAGTIWRCDMDGKNLELIAHNFRNEYEPCVDSFGTIFVSDNDDDGNQQTRICYVMPGGNYGYWPRGKGETHWHEEQPGVVPKVLRTYFGSPTGMVFYEGTLLPKKYQGQLLHCDAGPREVRCYHLSPKGAGYDVEREDIVTSTDSWFRPSAIRVAPDGSVFVADWYDPGVGGHGMGDTTRGRVYRLAPKGSKYQAPTVDLSNNAGMRAAFRSPNLAIRQMALATMRGNGKQDRNPVLRAALEQKDDGVLRSRAYQQLRGQVEGWTYYPLLTDKDPAYRALAIATCFVDVPTVAGGLSSGDRWFQAFDNCLHDSAPQVRRDVLIAIRNRSFDERTLREFWDLARQFDGHDRFYLAALGIAVGADPKRREIILADFDKHFPEWNDKVADLVWELRPPSVLPRLTKLLADGKLPASQRARIVDILATGPEPENGRLLLKTLLAEPSPEMRERILANLKLFLPTKWSALNEGKEITETIDRLLAQPDSAPLGLALIASAERIEAIPRIRKLLETSPTPAVAREAVRTLGALPNKDAVVVLGDLLAKGDTALAPAIMEALGQQIDARKNNPGQPPAMALLQSSVTAAGSPPALREAALSALVGSRTGTQWLLAEQAKHKLPADLLPLAGRFVRNTPYPDLRNAALIAFPAAAKLDIAKLPPLAELAKRRGDTERGKQLMTASLTGESQCLKCHVVQSVGGHVGPDLSSIGLKASRENLYESLLFPSKAIADQFVQWNVISTSGVSVLGLVVEETADHVTIRDANGKDTRIAVKDVAEKSKSAVSLMPADIATTLAEAELIDLVEYLLTLKTPEKDGGPAKNGVK
jgi:putative membrane-bound dehydrogenase-like protein